MSGQNNCDVTINQDGRFNMSESINARCLPEAWHRACLACWKQGIRVETPKHQSDQPLGYDIATPILITHPLEEPRIHKYAITDDPAGLENYRLEIAFGIHDHWVGDELDKQRWQYTYHGRFEQFDQINRAIRTAKKDFIDKGRFGRNYVLHTWDRENDIECPDPPCLQTIQWRILRDYTLPDVWRLNFVTTWRSRDLFKAWFENAYAITYWQKLLASQLSIAIGIDIQVGSYSDFAASNHLYGLYFKGGNSIEKLIQRMDEQCWYDFAEDTSWYLPDDVISNIRHTTAAQLAYEKHSLKQTGEADKKASIETMQNDKAFNCPDVMKFPYPLSWDA